jgi:hypothetical protein
MQNPFAAHESRIKRCSSFALFASFALKISLNNANLSRILTSYLPANQLFHVNRKFPTRGAQNHRQKCMRAKYEGQGRGMTATQRS